MKIQLKKMIRLCLLALFLPVVGSAYAQVKIGNVSNDPEPRKGALLDLDADTLGVLFPKVNLVEYNNLKPLIADATDGEKAGSKGMVVYNTNDQADGVAVGFVVWNGDEWQSLTGGGASMSKVSSVDCSGIQVKGTYLKNKPLDDKINKIILPVNVDRKGSYNILIEAYQGANPIVSNEYVFAASGEFFTTGIVPVTVEGQGIPKAATVNDVKDVLKIYINGQEITCPNDGILVGDKQPDYSFKCEHVNLVMASSDRVPGHTMGTANSDYISMRVTTPMDAAGAYWHVTTNTVNGVNFEGSGTLKGGTETLMLYGNGAIEQPGVFTYTVTSNNLSSQTCTVDMSVVYDKPVKIKIFGNGSNGDYAMGGDLMSTYKIANNSSIFGLNQNDKAPLQVSQINVIHTTDHPSITEDYNDYALIIVSYYRWFVNNTTAITHFVNDYLNQGGVALVAYEGGSSDLAALVNNISNANIISSSDFTENQDNGQVGAVPLIGNSPMVSGLFDLTGRNLSADGGLNELFNKLPSNEWEGVAVRTNGKALVIKHKTKDIYISGDGGTFAGGTIGGSPAQVDSNGNPIPSTNNQVGCYNGQALANLIFYAVEKYISNH